LIINKIIKDGMFMEAPIGVGLNELAEMKQIIVEKLISSFDGKTKYDMNNKYAIRDQNGQFIYHAVESWQLMINFIL
jgi:hypothetical protein